MRRKEPTGEHAIYLGVEAVHTNLHVINEGEGIRSATTVRQLVVYFPGPETAETGSVSVLM